VLAGQSTPKQDTAGGQTMPSSATAATNPNTVQHSQQRHHPYESEEEEEEEEGKRIRAAAAQPVPPSAIPWRPEVPPGGACIHGAQRTAAATDAGASYRRCGPAREATSGRGQEEHPDYAEVLHLLHALRCLVSRSAVPLVDHLIARFLDLTKRDR
jgi:hypothetical protein